ncbi:hypothetical protein QEZ54_20170 [Catellatospora sp. KI3]|uniref:hypothetical protein n=1 Tax=Catellatospora sp. KI3 TaxID=3041620 RepID=UPI002482BF65|nr:hypothetical protein [Catellatospora sp. KI3]MDI1463303.1 hypothetical protein [Catellatospora sp. KI3]
MPYDDGHGGFERASRTAHTYTVVRALAERAEFYVPVEHLADTQWLAGKIKKRSELVPDGAAATLSHAIAVDGSRMVVEARAGLPSVRYGYVQAGAVYLDLGALETQRQERFVDPVVLHQAARRALVALDLPTAGAYTRQGIDIKQSWREAVFDLFQRKRVEVNGLNQTLLELLYLLHGTPDRPASTIPVDCVACPQKNIAVEPTGTTCPACSAEVVPIDKLRLTEDVTDEGTNELPLTRLMQIVELLVVIGLMTLLWRSARNSYLPKTLFIVDGPLAAQGVTAPLKTPTLAFIQSMTQPGTLGPFICGVEKSSEFVDFAEAMARYDVLEPGQLLVIDDEVIAHVTNNPNPKNYGQATYWGRKFIYRATDGRVLVVTIPPATGTPYSKQGGRPEPQHYPTMPAILDVIDRTGSTMYLNALVPIALAHGTAAYPIGVGTDVLKLVAQQKLGMAQ